MTTRARIHPGDGDPRHGTLNGYKNLGCRCDTCREANRTDPAARRRRLEYNRRHYLPLDVWHAIVDAEKQPCGTHAAYGQHRKNGETPCDDCRTAEAAYKAARRAAARTNRCACGCGQATAGTWARGHHTRATDGRYAA